MERTGDPNIWRTVSRKMSRLPFRFTRMSGISRLTLCCRVFALVGNLFKKLSFFLFSFSRYRVGSGKCFLLRKRCSLFFSAFFPYFFAQSTKQLKNSNIRLTFHAIQKHFRCKQIFPGPKTQEAFQPTKSPRTQRAWWSGSVSSSASV